MLRQMTERAFYRYFGLFGQCFASFDVSVCVDLDVHHWLLVLVRFKSGSGNERILSTGYPLSSNGPTRDQDA